MRPTIVDPDFTATLEFADGRVWVHNEVSRYSKEVLGRLRVALDRLYDIAGTDVIWSLKDLDRMQPDAARKFVRFVELMGFTYSGQEEAGDLTLCAAFKRQREQIRSRTTEGTRPLGKK